MLRFGDCNDSSLVGLDNVFDFTRPVRVPGECNLTERDFSLYIALGCSLILARTGMSAATWYYWVKRFRAQKQAGKQPSGIRAVPIVPLITTFGAINLALFIALTYLGIARASDGTSLMLLNVFYFPTIFSSVFLVRKYIGVQRRMNGVKATRFTITLDLVYFSLIVIKFLITILCSIVMPGAAFWFKANFSAYAVLDHFCAILLLRTIQQVKTAVRAKSIHKDRASRVIQALTIQQFLLFSILVSVSFYWLGMGFWWTPTWPVALGIIAVEVFGTWTFLLANHVLGRTRRKRDDDSKVNNPIAPPPSMFIHSHVRLGTELRDGQDSSQSQLVRTLVIPAADTLLHRVLRILSFENLASQTILASVSACLGTTGIILSLVALCTDTNLPLFVAGFVSLFIVYLIVVATTLAIHVCRRLFWQSSVLYRLLFGLLWLFDFCDVLGWDVRCLAPIGFFLLWSLVFVEDACIKESKRWISPIISVLSAVSALCILVIIKFDLLFHRTDHLLMFIASGAASVSWSTYQATGDFSVVVFVLLVLDAFHIVRRRGLSHLLHFKGTIYVCIVPLGSRRAFNPISMRLMGPINFEELRAENLHNHAPPPSPDRVLSETVTSTTNDDENTSPGSPIPLSDQKAPSSVAPTTEHVSPAEPNIIPLVPNRNPQMADAADVVVKDGVLMNAKAPGGFAQLNTVILREEDSVAVRLLGRELGGKWLYWSGQPWMRVLIVWANALPITVWVALVLPGLIPIEYSLLSLVTLLVVMRNLTLKNVYMMRVIASTPTFWLKVLLYGVSLGFFAHMLFWDVRAFTLAVLFALGVDSLLVDARCVFFVKSAKRAYSERFFAIVTILYVLGNIIFTLTIIALPVVAGWGIIANARITAFIPLRPEAEAINGTGIVLDPINGEILRGSLARLNLYQFVSDFLTGMCFYVVLEFTTDLRLSAKQKTRRIQLKSFQALVHPIFTARYEDTTVQNDNTEVEEQREFGSIIGAETFHDDDNNLILADGTRVYFKKL